MSSLGVLRDLAAFFLPIGYVGTAIAVLCAFIAAVALARGAAGLAGGAVGCWIVGAVLSVTAGFSGQWLLLAVSGGALVAALVLGSVAHAVISRIPARPKPIEIATATEVETETATVARPRPVVLKAATQR